VLVYIEFIRRQPGVPLEGFHAIVNRGQTGWAGEYAEDVLLFNIGRTFRLGPEPEYMAVWYTPEGGLERIGEWERVFGGGTAADFEEPFRVAARIERAGCYEPLLEPAPGEGGPYYAEFFEPAEGVDRAAVRSFFEERCGRHADLALDLLIDRIGRLGPDPRGLAIWSAPDFGALDSIARELDGIETPIKLVDAGIYRDLGRETI
jgi:hypothetical protein